MNDKRISVVNGGWLQLNEKQYKYVSEYVIHGSRNPYK